MAQAREFITLSPEQRASIVNERRDEVLRVPKAVVKIGDLRGIGRSVLMPTHVEFPPTPIALEDKAAAQIFVHAPAGIEGAWQRFFLMVYRQGGRIFFRDLDTGDLEAVVRFPTQKNER